MGKKTLTQFNGGASGRGWSTCHWCCLFVCGVGCIGAIGDFERDFIVFFFNFFLNWVGFCRRYI
ncbi:hypothetical protein ES288_A04G015600v1 [Gossypium darwinii]|uniref:Uncharacterized protein n=2 Tax=Gossypium TaxID=3633 RepID=A0A5D2QWM4_GOSTO|nr:hypothetical protein ES288_A04G015600v1 [Gossypium darwinii]TYI31855.1 hypothetical protein ES332_A04G014700v1 [Gossypium tomentosum]